MTIQIHRSTDRQYFVRVVSSNHQPLVWSETYRDKASAVHCANLLKGLGGASVVDLT